MTDLRAGALVRAKKDFVLEHRGKRSRYLESFIYTVTTETLEAVRTAHLRGDVEIVPDRCISVSGMFKMGA